MPAPVWTIERIDELKRLCRRGAAYWRIAKRLGVTREAAIEQAVQLGLRRAPRRQAAAREDEPRALGGAREILADGVCHWIAGDTWRAWRMCGHSAVHGAPWCAHHLGRARGRIVKAAAAREVAA